MNIVEITLENAKTYLIDESFNRPVLIDFWAEWCGPCKNLMPVLEKLANAAQGAFLLAKVNSDDLGMLAAQFGVRSLPTVVLMKDGQPVDGFTGALPEKEVQEFLDKYLPKPWEKAVSDAQNLLQSGDADSALPLLRQAYSDSNQDHEIGFLLVSCYLHLARLDNAEVILANTPMKFHDQVYDQLRAQIALMKDAAKSPEVIALEAQLRDFPDDQALGFQLAVLYSQDKKHREALEILLAILKKDRNFAEGAVRKTYTDILVSLGKGDPLAIEFQRKLFTLLY